MLGIAICKFVEYNVCGLINNKQPLTLSILWVPYQKHSLLLVGTQEALTLVKM